MVADLLDAHVRVQQVVAHVGLGVLAYPLQGGLPRQLAADHLAESAKGGAYEAQAAKTAEVMRRQYSGKMMSDPSVIARAISRATNARRPKTRYLIGFGAKPIVLLHTILPTRWFDWMMMHAAE